MSSRRVPYVDVIGTLPSSMALHYSTDDNNSLFDMTSDGITFFIMYMVPICSYVATAKGFGHASDAQLSTFCHQPVSAARRVHCQLMSAWIAHSGDSGGVRHAGRACGPHGGRTALLLWLPSLNDFLGLHCQPRLHARSLSTLFSSLLGQRGTSAAACQHPSGPGFQTRHFVPVKNMRLVHRNTTAISLS